MSGELMYLMCEVDPSLRSEDQSVMYLRCKKALYGHIEAARLFYDDLNNTLKEKLNFEQNCYDPCVYDWLNEGERTTVRVHVDDLKISSVSKPRLLEVIRHLKEVYGEITEYLGVEHDYLGMVLSYRPEERKITFEYGKIYSSINSRV
jgi:hypothetical protein